MWDPYAEFEKVVLSNGLTIYATHWPNCEFETTRFLIHSGAAQDPIGLEGLAHFVEHLVSDNTDGVSGKEIKIFFKSHGGFAKLGSTGFSGTEYGFKSSVNKSLTSEAFSIFGKMLMEGEMRNNIEEQRAIIVGEFKKRYKLPVIFDLDLQKNKILFGDGHYMSRSTRPLGCLQSIKRIKKEDLQGFYDQHYTPANMSIICVGGLIVDEVVEVIRKSPFSAIKKGERSRMPPVFKKIHPLPKRERWLNASDFFKTPLNSAVYESSVRIPWSEINYYASYIFSKMLSYILNEEIREKRNWTYDVGSGINCFNDFIFCGISCGSFNSEAVNEIEDIVRMCIGMVDSEPLFKRIVEEKIAAISMDEHTSVSLCQDVAENLTFDRRIISSEEEIDSFKKLKFNDVRNLFQWFQPEFRWVEIMEP
ncbi:MAG: pitrilysin family protein [Patescibacteria group bacterium]|jgi:predicted Zn-dependent peptidase|nr:pitrilysin family protein [Patescibacteria group bacterium]